MQVTYHLRDGSKYTAPMHKQPGGKYSFTLANGEKLTRIEGMVNQHLIGVLTFTAT